MSTQSMTTQTNQLFKIQEYFIENKVQTGREESQSFKNAREFFYKKYIKTSYKINDDNTGYIIFSSANPARANMSDMYVREANGLILEINTWNVVVYPHQSVCKYNINTDVANKFLAKGFYKIYKLYDGTKVNLYFDRHTPSTPITTANTTAITSHIDLTNTNTTDNTTDNTEIKLYDIREDTTSVNEITPITEMKSTVISPSMGTWTISTTNGLAMNDIVWNGMTYQQAFNEVLQKYQLNWESFTSELDRNCSYTFSFKHPVYHPFREGRSTDIYRLLFLKAVDTSTGKDVELSPTIKVDLQEEVYADNMKILYNNAYNSYDNFIKEMSYREQGNSQGDRQTDRQTEMKFAMPCYGYIIRSNQPNETFPEHDLFIESRLMQKIRKFMYETEYNKVPDKMELICLHNYLSPMNISEFISLFPQFNDKYQRYKQFFGQLLKEMLDQDMNNPQKLKSNQKGQKKQDTPSVVVSDGSDGSSVYTIKQLATFLLSQLQSLLNTDTLGKNKTTYYKNFILHPKFVYSYYNVMKTTV